MSLVGSLPVHLRGFCGSPIKYNNFILVIIWADDYIVYHFFLLIFLKCKTERIYNLNETINING